MYSQKLTSKHEEQYRLDKQHRIDPRTLGVGDPCVVRIETSRGGVFSGQEYGGVALDTLSNGQVKVNIVRITDPSAKTTLTLIPGADNWLMSHPIRGRQATAQKGKGIRKETVTVIIPDHPSLPIGYVLPAGKFAAKPIEAESSANGLEELQGEVPDAKNF